MDVDIKDTVNPLRVHLRSCFPQLTQENAVVFLDNAAGSLVPQRSIDAVTKCLTSRGVCNAMPSYAFGRAQIDVKSEAHEGTALFVNAASASEIAIGPSATAMSFRLAAAFARNFDKDAAVIVSGLEHECNASPWRETGAEIRVWEPRWPAGELCVDDLALLLADGRVRVLALTACSNAFGLLTPVAAAAIKIKAAGAFLVVDAVHAAPHALPDVQRDGIDCLLFSPYKIFAPHLGVLYVRAALLPALNVPTLWFYEPGTAGKFEYGTPPFEALAGWVETLRYLAEDVGGATAGSQLTRGALETAYKAIAALEAPLLVALATGLASIAGVKVYGTLDAAKRVGTVAFNIGSVPPSVVARCVFDESNVCISSGHFYATLPCASLGVMPDGVVRASVAHYNTVEEVEALVLAVRRISLINLKSRVPNIDL